MCPHPATLLTNNSMRPRQETRSSAGDAPPIATASPPDPSSTPDSNALLSLSSGSSSRESLPGPGPAAPNSISTWRSNPPLAFVPDPIASPPAWTSRGLIFEETEAQGPLPALHPPPHRVLRVSAVLAMDELRAEPPSPCSPRRHFGTFHNVAPAPRVVCVWREPFGGERKTADRHRARLIVVRAFVAVDRARRRVSLDVCGPAILDRPTGTRGGGGSVPLH